MKWLRLIGLLILSLLGLSAISFGQGWQPLTNKSSVSIDVPLLLTDGSILCHQYASNSWWRFRPDINGSYVDGSWSPAGNLPAGYAPLYFSSAVLADGRAIVIGGEYNNLSAVWTNRGAIYDPNADTWTEIAPPPGWANIGDAQCAVMPDGKFLLANPFDTRMAILDPVSLTWTNLNGAGKLDRFDEEGWTLMPDGTIVTLDAINNPHAERYLPTQDTWISAGNTPQTLVNAASQEMGPTVLMPDGTVVAFGATGHNARYTPGVNFNDPGTWTSLPDFPILGGGQLDIADGPAVLLPSGNVLTSASPGIFGANTRFFEFDGVNLNQVPTTPRGPSISTYMGNMLMLPTGQVFYTDQSSDIQIYTPVGTPNDAWRPTITDCPSIIAANQSFTITGTQFNGLSQCCSYGDDAGNATNYPLVRLTNLVTGHVFYCPTRDHSTMAVQTNSLPTFTTVTIPANVEPGSCSLEVVTNGIASLPFLVVIGDGTQSPFIASFEPSSIQANTPSFQLIIHGLQFQDGDQANWVENGTSTPLTTVFGSSSVMSATVPAELFLDPKGVAIRITRADGSQSNLKPFTVTNDAPIINSLSPNSVMASSGDVTVTINGSRFLPDDTVVWSSAGSATTLPITYISANVETVVIPAALTVNQGSATVSVVNSRGRGSAPATFTITTDVPFVSFVTPTSIPAFSPDTVVSIVGGRFRSSDIVKLTLNGITTTIASTFNSVTSIDATIPASSLTQAGGTAFLTVVDAKGQQSNGGLITIDNPLPIMTSISPAAVPLGSPTTVVTIVGDHLVSTATVTFKVGTNKTPISSTWISSTQMTCTVPASLMTAAVKASIVVNNPAPGGGEASLAFSVGNLIKLNSVSPNSLSLLQPVTITARGSGFATGAVLHLGNQSITTTVSTDSLLTAQVPGSAVSQLGSIPVWITNSDGGISNSLSVSVSNGSPKITSLSPNSVRQSAGTFTLTVNGSGFVPSSVVRWSGTNVATTFISTTQLKAVIPASLFPKLGNYSVTVQNPSPGGGGSNGMSVNVN